MINDRELKVAEWIPLLSYSDELKALALQADVANVPGEYFNLRKTTIYAGSTEIQKNIISKMIVGL